MSIRNRMAETYVSHAQDALEVLVGKQYDDVAPSLRLRAYLGKHEQLKNLERQCPEYADTFTELRREYTLAALIAVHNLVDQTIEKIAGPNIVSIADHDLEAVVGDVREELGSLALAA